MAGASGTSRPIEFWLLLIGTIAGVIAAIAAVAVFAFKSADGRSAGTSATRPAIPAPSTPAPTPTPALSPTRTVEGTSRNLASLTPVAGQGFLKKKGNDLSLPCPTNQSDDTFHEVSYALPARYEQFVTGMTVAGTADAEATAALEVFIQHRQDRSDRQVRVGDPVALRQRGSTSLSRPLGEAVLLTLRVTCRESGQVIVLTGPRITRATAG